MPEFVADAIDGIVFVMECESDFAALLVVLRPEKIRDPNLLVVSESLRTPKSTIERPFPPHCPTFHRDRSHRSA